VRPGRAAFFAVLVVTAGIVQVSGVDFVPVPYIHPDLVLVVVIACALAGGPVPGALTGFGAGLLMDLLPPAVHVVGRLALLYTVVGYLAGKLHDVEERSLLAPLAVVAALSAAAVAVNVGIGTLLSDVGVRWSVALRQIPAVAIYDVILTPFIVPLVSYLSRRIDPDVARR
jgi:rod shape-determining protein MreD